MLLIIAHHYVVNSGLTAADGPIYSDPLSWRSFFLLVFGAWGKIGINCFVLITGYFMCTSHITVRKFIKLLAEVMFYRLVINGVFWITGYRAFAITDFVKTLIPVTEIGTGFTNAFLVFYLCIPFLNVLIHNINKRQHVYLLMLCFLTYILLGSISVFSITMNYVSWFIVVYFIASYIRLYPKTVYGNARVWKWLSFLTVLLSAVSVIVCTWLGTILHRNMAYGFVSDSNAFLAVITAIALFMTFKNSKIGYSRAINTVAASTFGVFLIHTRGDTMRQWLWKDVFDNVGHYGSSLLPLYAIGSVFLIFIICIVIDQLRICFIEKPFFTLWDKHWDSVQTKYKTIETKIASKLGIRK